MKISLAALIAGCAVASSAFASFDFPPINPPHFAAMTVASFDFPPINPPHFEVVTVATQQNA
jgi:hypothetical protein